MTYFLSLPYWTRLFLGILATSLASLLARATRDLAPASVTRLASSALPALILLLSPRLFFSHDSEPLLLVPTLGFFSIAAFKLTSFAIGRGPLADSAIVELPATKFLAWTVLPVLPPKGKEEAEWGGKVPGVMQLVWESTLQLVWAPVLFLVADNMSGLPRTYLYGIAMSLALGCLWDFFRAVAASLGMVTGKGFDRPWLASSVGELWASRWNLVAGRMLRALVRDPIIEGRLARPWDKDQVGVADNRKPAIIQQPALITKQPSALRQYLAIQLTFSATGLWHALILYPPTSSNGDWTGGWRWFLFFSLQGPIVALERLWVFQGLPVAPRPIRVVLTTGYVAAIAGPLFFGVYESAGAMDRIRGEAKKVVAWVVELADQWVAQ